MSYEMNERLELVVDQNASDRQIQVGQPPTLRRSGSMGPIEGGIHTPADTEKLMLSITPDAHQQAAKLQGGADFGFACSAPWTPTARPRPSTVSWTPFPPTCRT